MSLAVLIFKERIHFFCQILHLKKQGYFAGMAIYPAFSAWDAHCWTQSSSVGMFQELVAYNTPQIWLPFVATRLGFLFLFLYCSYKAHVGNIECAVSKSSLYWALCHPPIHIHQRDIRDTFKKKKNNWEQMSKNNRLCQYSGFALLPSGFFRILKVICKSNFLSSWVIWNLFKIFFLWFKEKI